MFQQRGPRFIGGGLLVALFAMVLAAASAQAADWLYEVSPGIHELVQNTNALPIALEEDQTGTLLATINGLKAEISCTAQAVSEGFLETEGKTKGKVKFTGCSVKNGGKATACEPHSAGQPVGTIQTVALKGQLVANEKEVFVSIEPQTGTTLASIELGEACAFGETIPITGKAGLKDCSNPFNLLVLALRHLIELDEARSSLKALGNSAIIDSGSVWVKLTNDKRWKAMLIGEL